MSSKFFSVLAKAGFAIGVLAAFFGVYQYLQEYKARSCCQYSRRAGLDSECN